MNDQKVHTYSIESGGAIGTDTFGPGQAGDIAVNSDGGSVQVTARESINLTGASPVSLSTINGITFSDGNVGEVVVVAPLTLR